MPFNCTILKSSNIVHIKSEYDNFVIIKNLTTNYVDFLFAHLLIFQLTCTFNYFYNAFGVI